MQQEMERVQEELANTSIEGSAGGGALSSGTETNGGSALVSIGSNGLYLTNSQLFNMTFAMN